MEIIEHKNVTVDVKNEIEMYKNLSSQQKKGFINYNLSIIKYPL